MAHVAAGISNISNLVKKKYIHLEFNFGQSTVILFEIVPPLPSRLQASSLPWHFVQNGSVHYLALKWLHYRQRKYTPKLHKAIIFPIPSCGFLRLLYLSLHDLAWVFTKANSIKILSNYIQMSPIPLLHRMFESKFAPTISLDNSLFHCC